MDQNLKTDAVTLTKTLCAHLAGRAVRRSFGRGAARGAARRARLDRLRARGLRPPHHHDLLGVLQETSGKPPATVLGRKLKLGLLDAPLANGQMGHVLDYDDTHMGGVVLHTSSPVLAALFALAERAPVSGEQFMLAYAVGFEAGVRSGRTAPGHHKGGWHLTGTLGSIAAGAAAGKLLDLDAQRLTYAMGIAATQAGGMQQNRGTMCKSFHAGKAAANGVLAALLAERGFDSTQEIIEGKKGFARIYSDTAEPEHLTEGLGNGWLIESNGHKPYACGVVLHPLIDAVIAIRNRDSDRSRRGERDRAAGASAGAVDHRRGRAFDRIAVEVLDAAFRRRGADRRRGRHRAVLRRQGDRSGGGGAAAQGQAGRRRDAAQGRGLCQHRRGRQAPRGAYRARQRHRRQSDERRADRGEVLGQCRAGDRRRARAARGGIGLVTGEAAGHARR